MVSMPVTYFSIFKRHTVNYKFVEINKKSSNVLPINYGVPQGSDLGPLLFLIYINDLNGAVTHWKVRYFADDTNVICQQFFERQKQKGQL